METVAKQTWLFGLKIKTGMIKDATLSIQIEGQRMLWSKSKSYDATMKRAIKEHPLEIRNILRNKRISLKFCLVLGIRSLFRLTLPFFKIHHIFYFLI
jgi:hypothetical protein